MRSHINKDVQRWMKWFLPFYLFTFLPLVAQAQSITGRAPQQVAAGEQFRLTYTVNTQDVKGFRAGNIPEELEVLMDRARRHSRVSKWSTATCPVRRR